MKPEVIITEFTDPACTWCWGDEPILRKLKYHFQNQLEINYVMGGLTDDARKVVDTANGIGAGNDLKKLNEQVAAHWVEASQRHGMPVKTDGFNLMTNTHYSTFPMNIAYKAAQFESDEAADRLLRRMREATAAEARQSNRDEVLEQLAEEAGINMDSFKKHYYDGSAAKAFLEDRAFAHSLGVHGFPAFLIQTANGKSVLLNGYQSYETFISVIQYLLGHPLKDKTANVNEEEVLNFIRYFHKGAFAEIKENFDLTSEQTERYLQELEKQNLIKKIPAGNSAFYQAV